MELTPFVIYVIMSAGSIAGVFVLLGLAIAVSVLIHMCIKLCDISARENTSRNQDNADERAVICRHLVPGILAVALCFMVAILSPTTKTLATMYAVPAAIKLADGLELDDTAKKMVAAVNKLLDEYAKK